MRRFIVLGVAALAAGLCVASSVSAQTLTGQSEPVFRHVGFARGDSNGDGIVNIGDAVAVFSTLFLGFESVSCEAAADADGSAEINVADGVYLLDFLSLGGAPPVAPFPGCGAASTGGLGCAQEPCSEATGRSFTLFGQSFEADSVVFAIGRSPIMGLMERRGLAEDLKGALAALPPTLPFDVVYYDGEQAVNSSSDATPSITLSTGQEMANSAVDSLFVRRSGGDDLSALFATAIECSRRGAGEERVVIYIGDGWDQSFGVPNLTPEGSGSLNSAPVFGAVQELNATDPVTIHTIGVNRYLQVMRTLMSQIARQNGGIFTSGGQVLVPVVYNPSC